MITQKSLSHHRVLTFLSETILNAYWSVLFKNKLLPLNSLPSISLFHSGGLTVRAILETMDDHNVDSFISLSSPQMGQYGGI